MSLARIRFTVPLTIALGLAGCSKPVKDDPFDIFNDASFYRDGGASDAPSSTDMLVPNSDAMACGEVAVRANVERQPVDIIWVVDNSSSMEPAVRQVTNGINAFAQSIGDRDLDYRVIMLSMRGKTRLSSPTRFPVCVPTPLAGDNNCSDGERFFHVEMDVQSTQPLEQLLGTLGQTAGYLETDSIGSAPWRHLLREGASKSIVIVTDDNARSCNYNHGNRCQSSEPNMSDLFLSDFEGGPNPFNSRVLPAGLLMEYWGGLFDGYTFSAIYGWGSESDIDEMCTYSDDTEPESPGQIYTKLVESRHGVRAKICDGASAWDDFFNDVAQTVDRNSGLDCEIDIPDPPQGMSFTPGQVNVDLVSNGTTTRFPNVREMIDCGVDARAWYYDDELHPESVRLCPAACRFAQDQVREHTDTEVRLQFGCDTILY